MLTVTALALLASQVGLEAVLGAFLAGGLARSLDPDPAASHSVYLVKLDAIGGLATTTEPGKAVTETPENGSFPVVP